MILAVFAWWCGLAALVVALSPAGRGNYTPMILTRPLDVAVDFLLVPAVPFLWPSVIGAPLSGLIFSLDDSGALTSVVAWAITALLWTSLVLTALHSGRFGARMTFLIILGVLSVLLLLSWATAIPVCT